MVRTQPEPSVVEIPFIFNDRDKGDSKMNSRVQWLFVRRLAALGGARMTLGNLSRFGLVGLSGVAVDLLVFWWMQSLGTGLATAHCTSFLVATASNFALNYRWTFAREFDTEQAPLRRYGAFLVVALLALVLRGGIFAWLTGGLGAAAGIAILPAVAMTAVVNYLGSIFYVFPAQRRGSRPEIRWRIAALGLISCSLLLRWLYLGQAELIFDEMYYWTYTLHPALSYLDHPPLTAWLIALGTALGGDNAFGVRLPTLLLGPLALVFAYLYVRDLLDKTRGLIAAMLVAVVPAWFASGFLMTTDAALFSAWLAALYFLQRALLQRDAGAWLAVGASIGIGALSKYTIVSLAPAILIFILIHKPSRGWLLRWQPWAGGVISLAIFSPVLVWNARHDWASFTFQSSRRIVEDPGFNSHWVPIHGIVMLAPLAGLAALYLLGPVRRRLCPQPAARRFMLTMTLVPLSIIVFFATLTETRYHWVVPVWLGLLPLLAASVAPPQTRAGNVARQEEKPLIWLQTLWRPVLPMSLVLIGLSLHYVSLGLPGLGWREHRLGYLGWPEIARSVHELEIEIEQATGRRPIVAGMAKWGISSALAFHDVDQRRDNITARNLVGMSGSQWERWFDRDSDPSRPVLLVSHERKLIDESWLELALVELGPLQSRPVHRDGQVIQRLYFRIGAGFRTEMVRYPGHIP
ncbi:MAG: glycosyltransferase family 39 protein [Xanthomonadaceae bacterium]|nr:glycosyltransferase family 39 protein [Xanthomonadaceae bacterium]